MSFPVYVLGGTLIVASTAGGVIAAGQQRLLAVALAMAGATILLLFHSWYFDFYADDALITLRYSHHLAEGSGPNWNSEGRVEGYTTFLWMGIHAGLAKIGIDIVNASRALGLAAVVATMLFMARLWQLWSDEESDAGIASPFVIAAAMLALVLTDGVAFWGFSGMETTAFMALLTLSAVLFLQEQRTPTQGWGGLPWSAVAFAATAMTRPEGLLAVAVTAGFFALQASLATDRREALRRLAAWSAIFLALYGAYFVWRYTYYDYLLPNTFYAKVGTTSAIYER